VIFRGSATPVPSQPKELIVVSADAAIRKVLAFQLSSGLTLLYVVLGGRNP